MTLPAFALEQAIQPQNLHNICDIIEFSIGEDVGYGERLS